MTVLASRSFCHIFATFFVQILEQITSAYYFLLSNFQTYFPQFHDYYSLQFGNFTDNQKQERVWHLVQLVEGKMSHKTKDQLSFALKETKLRKCRQKKWGAQLGQTANSKKGSKGIDRGFLISDHSLLPLTTFVFPIPPSGRLKTSNFV